ncbi:MAG TPA: alpha/beta hydrolase [Geminicoccus sp.]|uniref:alpha/beta hydrolase n=1 Tax=Geminicoccus sp. TaxID=2024832 RepID=UPI002E34E6A5|nr:alpha/beta hydrolase [Geminicoccus sp.]HEX2529375.1 alpha/beta hydrolase [Geminicoccus sp.]
MTERESMHLPRLAMEPAEVDRLYDAGRAVPDSAVRMAGWTERSRQARARLDGRLDVAYGPSLDEYLDVFPGPVGGPLHVFIHGGYWRRFTAKDFSFVAEPLVAQGYTVVVPNYALCPRVRIGEIVRQVRAALHWTIHHPDVHGGDIRRLTISGHSAGGHLVGMMLATDWSAWRSMPAEPVAAAVALSGLYDLAPFAYSWLQPVLQLDHHDIEQLSPVRQVKTQATSLILAAGQLESPAFHAQAGLFEAVWRACGNRVERSTCGDRDHFTIVEDLPALLERETRR